MTGKSVCPSCDSERSEHWTTARDVEYGSCADSFIYRRCLDCNSLYIDPIPVERLSEIYPANYYSYNHKRAGNFVRRFKDKLDSRIFVRLLSSLSGNRLSVLDVGGGAGHHLDLVRRADGRVATTTVVDLDASAQSEAEARGHRFWRGRFESVETDERFDLIIMLNIIEHVADPAAVLRKAAGLLAPNGLIVVKTPNWDSLDERLFRHRNWTGYHCPRHWVLWDMPGFDRLIRRCGLAARAAWYTQGAPFWSSSILALLAQWGLIEVSARRPAPYHPLYSVFNMLFAAIDFARKPFARTSQMIFLLQSDRE